MISRVNNSRQYTRFKHHLWVTTWHKMPSPSPTTFSDPIPVTPVVKIFAGDAELKKNVRMQMIGISRSCSVNAGQLQQRKFQDFRRSKLKESDKDMKWIFQGSMKLIRNTHQSLWPLSPFKGTSLFKRISAQVLPLLPLMLQQICRVFGPCDLR